MFAINLLCLLGLVAADEGREMSSQSKAIPSIAAWLARGRLVTSRSSSKTGELPSVCLMSVEPSITVASAHHSLKNVGVGYSNRLGPCDWTFCGRVSACSLFECGRSSGSWRHQERSAGSWFTLAHSMAKLLEKTASRATDTAAAMAQRCYCSGLFDLKADGHCLAR